MATRALLRRSKNPNLAPLILRILTSPLHHPSRPPNLRNPSAEPHRTELNFELRRLYHDGRPRGPLWRGKKMIGKEALFVIQGLKRFKGDEERLEKFVKSHVLRLLKMDKIAVLNELQRQEEVDLALKVRFPLR